jgi:serine/threonine protein kinase/tetratricopeptide (TPR) repeat protein
VSGDPLQSLFDACLDLPRERWEERLAACPDPALREQARRLLAAHELAESAGDPLAAVAASAMPERVGPYRILERIGDGGMGEVYLAEQLEPVRRQVAIKIIKLGMDTREVIARFEVERQTLALMSHPNVARILDAGATDTGRPYFVMEYVPGVPIVRYCDERELDVESRLRLFVQVCAGVQHAHHRGIIHRDLKPSNILVAEIDGEPQPKIIDFGIAKATSLFGRGDSPHTRLGHVLGTPGYMSPEQEQLSPLDIDTRTDVYSLGALLYELLTGTVPSVPVPTAADAGDAAAPPRDADIEKPSERVRRNRDGKDDRARRRGVAPVQLAAELREDLDWIVMKALERDRRRRYDSVAALAADVEASLADQPVSAGPPSATYRLRKFARRHRVLVTSGVALALATVVFSALMALQVRETARARDRAALEAATADQVSRVLVELFSSSDPATARGRTFTARDMLDRAAARLDTERDLEPLVRARLQLAIGEVFLNLGEDEQALNQFRAARDTLTALPAATVPDRLAAARGIGRAMLARSRYGEADPVLSAAFDQARQTLPDGHPLVADLTSDLAVLRYYQGRNAEALDLARAAVQSRGAAYGENSEKAIASIGNLGVIVSRTGDHAGAEVVFRDALARIERHLGSDHPERFKTGMNLAAELSRAGRHDETVAIYQSLLPHARRIFGDSHPTTLTMSGNYAAALGGAGRHAEALQLLEQLLADVVDELGPDSREAMFWEAHLGNALANNGRFAEAERRLSSVLARQTELRGVDNFDTLNTRNAYGDVLAAQGRHEEAIDMVAPVPALAASSLGPTSSIRRSALLRLADASFALGRTADAERWWREARGLALPLALSEYPELERRLAAGSLEPPQSAAAAVGASSSSTR